MLQVYPMRPTSTDPSVRVRYPRWSRTRRSSLEHTLRLERGTRADWDTLAPFHYHSQSTSGAIIVWSYVTDEALRLGPRRRVVGVIVYQYPSLNNRARNQATGGRYVTQPRTIGIQRLNRELITIGRVVIDPQFRGLGLAYRLVRQTMPQMGKPLVESLARMGRVNPFFEKAGMQAYDVPMPRELVRLRDRLLALGADGDRLTSPSYMARWVRGLSVAKRQDAEHLLLRNLRNLDQSRRARPWHQTLDRAIHTVCAGAWQMPVYYLWRNPAMPLEPVG